MTKRKVPRYDLEDLLKDLTPEDVSLDFDWGQMLARRSLNEKEFDPTRKPILEVHENA